MYGCGDAKLASTLKKPQKQGKKLKDQFWKANPAIKRLIEDLESSYDKHPGYIYGLDGRRLRVRDKRKLLNTLLQNAATIVFKLWMIKVDELNLSGLDQMIAYHDEIQFEYDAHLYGPATIPIIEVEGCARQVGEELNLNVPIAAEGKRGRTWADTH